MYHFGDANNAMEMTRFTFNLRCKKSYKDYWSAFYFSLSTSKFHI